MAHAHKSFGVGIALFSISSFALLIWIMVSKLWNRNVIVPSFFMSVLTLLAMLTGYFDIDIHNRPDGATHAPSVGVLLVAASLCLSYASGAFLFIDTESSLLVHFLTLVEGLLLVWAAKFNNNTERWTFFAFAMLFYFSSLYTIWAQRTRRDREALVVLISYSIIWTLTKILWILGEGSDWLRFGEEMSWLVFFLFLGNIIVPVYMCWFQGPVVAKTDGATGKQTYYLWRLFGHTTYTEETKMPAVHPQQQRLFGARR